MIGVLSLANAALWPFLDRNGGEVETLSNKINELTSRVAAIEAAAPWRDRKVQEIADQLRALEQRR